MQSAPHIIENYIKGECVMKAEVLQKPITSRGNLQKENFYD